MRYFNDIYHSKDWKKYHSDKKEGILIETRADDDGINCVKSTGVVNYS